MKKIKISILIANYNGEKYLRRCINSCLSQNTKSRFEIIFIDDNSTDSSLAIVKEFKKKLKLIKKKKKRIFQNLIHIISLIVIIMVSLNQEVKLYVFLTQMIF